MSNPSIIKIADYAERLSRLRLDEREGRPLAPGEIEREYDRVCLAVFGHTADDFGQNDFPDDLADWYQVVDEDGAEAFANQHGYSLKRHTGTMLGSCVTCEPCARRPWCSTRMNRMARASGLLPF